MSKIKIKIDKKKIKKKLKRLPLILAQKAFFTFLGFVLVIFIMVGIIFYYFGIYSPSQVEKESKPSMGFNQAIYENILQTIKERNENFLKTKDKEYPNLFQSEFLSPQETPPESPEQPISLLFH